MEDRRIEKDQKLLYLDDQVPSNIGNSREEDIEQEPKFIDQSMSVEETASFTESSNNRRPSNKLEEPLDVEPIRKTNQDSNKIDEIEDPW